ncbi:MAG TPA: VOC family protein [Gemmatimonadota bacterium]|nr:VOC family protein [Gemmatimonadota bacterium]
MKKLTPILVVAAIEPCLPFWVDALGFARTVEVPHEDALGFVILEKDGYEVMLQSIASMKADVPAAVPPPGGSVLFLEVEDLRAIESAVAEFELLVPRRKTFYGAEEIFVREPGGNVVGFAQFGTEEGESQERVTNRRS